MTQDYRTMLITDWIKFCGTNAGLMVESNFDLTKNVVEQHVIRTWINQQLPDDQNSIENAIFLKYSLKWPLIIDPQNQVIRWIKEMEGESLKICKSEDPLLLRTLEQAIRLGQPVLIENVTEHLDPLLDPILRKEVVTRGAQKVVKLGDVEVEYNETFRLYLVTSLPNPHYLPSAFIKVNLINFTITFKCLFEQFLSLVVLKERPELEKERTMLLESIAEDFATLRELEDKSLSILSKSEADDKAERKTLLDDQDLIDVLKKSKETSIDISIRLKRNEDTEKNLNVARQKYSAIATRATILYFSVQNLTELNIMYQFSLSWFYNVFQSCLGGDKGSVSRRKNSIMSGFSGLTSRSSSAAVRLGAHVKDTSYMSLNSMPTSQPPNEDTAPNTQRESDFDYHIESIIGTLTHTVYQVVSWGMFAEHKLIFSFSICVNILKNDHSQAGGEQTISAKEYNFFLSSTLLADMQLDVLSERIQGFKMLTFPTELLVDDKTLRQILLLEETLPDKFAGLCSNMEQHLEAVWRRFMDSSDPYDYMAIEDHHKCFDFGALSKFQKLILIKLLRPDALITSVNHFIHEVLGVKFLNAAIPTLNELYNQSLSHTPIIFILSAGSDPTNQLLRYAKESRGSALHLDIVSLGKGQGPKAEELINKSLMLKGRWIFLQNCHLAASFMPRLLALVNK